MNFKINLCLEAFWTIDSIVLNIRFTFLKYRYFEVRTFDFKTSFKKYLESHLKPKQLLQLFLKKAFIVDLCLGRSWFYTFQFSQFHYVKV
ncbi:hypothetical protein LEP1GSC126_3113 [Leptospira kirschneri str. 200801774]|nr:hypothetical protein LEP1GSC126_3113 [Leptospira kirschneri str. 200801774]